MDKRADQSAVLLRIFHSLMIAETNTWHFQGFIAKAVSGAMPIKVSAIFLVHQPRLFGFIWSVLSPFLSSKIRARVKIIGDDSKRVFEELPPDVVAAELGGVMQVDSAACAAQLLQLQQHRDERLHAYLF